MTNLNRGECRMVLRHMVVERRDLVERMKMGDLIIRLAIDLLAELEDFAEQQQIEADATIRGLMVVHVDATGQFAAALNAIRTNPRALAEERSAAGRVFQVSVADRAGYGHSASNRVRFADDVISLLPRLAADLAMFPGRPGVPSMRSLLDAWLAAADRIRQALEARVVMAESRPLSEIVREVNSLMSLVRSSVRTELKLDSGLPGNAEQLLLGFADSLLARRARPKPVVSAELPPVEPHDQAPDVGPVDPPVLVHAHTVDVDPEAEVG